MSQKLIFMKIQDGRQEGGHVNPNIKILELDNYNDYKNVGLKIYPWVAWGPYLPTRLHRPHIRRFIS